MILPTGTTVAVSDGTVLRLFRNSGVRPGVHLIEIKSPALKFANSGSGTRHHTGSANSDPKRLAEDDFAASTAAFLNKLSLDGVIEHLVVVADPRTLGEMRKHFHANLVRKLIREFAKDLSRRPIEDIASLIADA